VEAAAAVVLAAKPFRLNFHFKENPILQQHGEGGGGAFWGGGAAAAAAAVVSPRMLCFVLYLRWGNVSSWQLLLWLPGALVAKAVVQIITV
jgi:hypothetical protein